jgi:uncharacterized membrane protein YqiK
MSKAARYGFGALSGAAGGAGIGSTILPGVGTAIGAGVGGLAGLLGGVLSDNEDDEKRKRAMALLEQRQALENDVYDFKQKNEPSAMSRVFNSPAFSSFPLYNREKEKELRARQQAYEWEAAKQGMEPQDPSAGEWIGALLGAGGAVAGALKSDPNASRRAQLNATSDEADWINAHDLPNRATAIEENDARARSALFGPRRRMNPYEF